MRRKKADLHARVNDNWKMEFTAEGLTSYAGLELLMRYLRIVDWNRQLRRHVGSVGFGGDFGGVSPSRVLLGLLWVGGRRLRHLDFLKGDPLLQPCLLQATPVPGRIVDFETPGRTARFFLRLSPYASSAQYSKQTWQHRPSSAPALNRA